MLSMSTLSIQFSHLITLYTVLCKSYEHQCIDSLDKHSIQCIVCLDLHIDSVDKQDPLLNTQ